jgi:hypothetical protein
MLQHKQTVCYFLIIILVPFCMEYIFLVVGTKWITCLQLLGGVSPSPSPVSSLSEGSPRRLGNHPNSVEDFNDIPAPRVLL